MIVLLSGCGIAAFSQNHKGNSENPGVVGSEGTDGPLEAVSPAQRKINPAIRSALREMRSKGVTMENAHERKTSSFSNLLVRVDDNGNIQTYIYVSVLDSSAIDELKSKGVTIELINERLKIIQGWIPFDMIDTLAKYDFVIKIKPPDYGVGR